MNQTKEILILEDEETGKIYAQLLKKHDTAWKVTWVRTINEVKNYKDLEKLHVFIFDQRLEKNELGTDAFQYIHKKNPRVQGIMLSGMARAQDLMEAQRIVGNTIQYINKENALNLPVEVRAAIERYYSSLPQIDENKKLNTGLGFNLFSRKPEVILLSYYIIEPNYIFEDEWQVDVKIRSGEKVKRVKTIKNITNTAIIKEVATSLFSNTEVYSKFIKKGLENRFNLKFNSKTESGVEESNIDERLYELPKKENFVQRNYEYTQVFTFCRVHLSVRCPVCHETHYLDYDVYIPQYKILERCVDYYSDSKEEIIPLSARA